MTGGGVRPSRPVSASRHDPPVRQQCVAVSVDRIEFRELIHVGVRVEAEDLRTGLRRHTNSGYLTFVAIDAAGRPALVPAIAAEAEHNKSHAAAQLAAEPAP